MMYGFGDDANPRQDSVELVEELLLEYLTQVVRRVLCTSSVLVFNCLAVDGRQEGFFAARRQGENGGFAFCFAEGHEKVFPCRRVVVDE